MATLLTAAALNALAQCPVTLTISPATTGNFDNAGYQFGGAPFQVGHTTNLDVERRDFFAFNLPPLSNVLAAELRVNARTVAIAGNAETFLLREVTTPITEFLRYTNTARPEIFADLGDGIVYGQRDFTTNDAGQIVSIPLSTAFVERILTNRELVLGGSISTLDSTDAEFLFAGSYGTFDVQLVLTMATNGPPFITEQPATATSEIGQAVEFHVNGCADSYQWYFQNALEIRPIAGATNNTLTFTPSSLNDIGGYSVVLSNAFGSRTSTVALLLLRDRPPTLYVYEPSAFEGDWLRLDVSVDAYPATALQWFSRADDSANRIAIPGATNRTLIVSDAQPGIIYSIQASNRLGIAERILDDMHVQPRRALDRWQWRSTLPQGNNLFAVALETAFTSPVELAVL